MNKANTILIIILLAVIAGCGGGNKHSTGDLITVDVTKSYPTKEVILQDVFDVEYIPLDDTSDEFLTMGLIRAIGKEMIITRNMGNGGDIYIFDRNGKGLRAFNRKGQGPGEYASFSFITLDEDNNEMFVFASSQQKTFVYDLFGNFQRSLVWDRSMIIEMVGNFDHDNLIINVDSDLVIDIEDGGSGKVEDRFYLMSKKDGTMTPIQIPYEQRILRNIYGRNGEVIAYGARNQALIPNRHGWALTELSSDTIYRLLPDLSLIPFIARTPSVQSMNPEVFLFPSAITDRYVFMQTVKKQSTTPHLDSYSTHTYPRRDLMYDINEKVIFEYTVYNDDFTVKKPVKLAFESYANMPFINNDIAIFIKLESHELVEAYGKGELKGRLKEVAAELNAESNPVIMIAKHKK